MQNEMIFDVVVDEGCYMPESAHDDDAGYDLRTPEPFILCQGQSVTVDTGVHIAIPKGYVGFLKIFLPIAKPELRRVQVLEQTERGDGGFGSTGA